MTAFKGNNERLWMRKFQCLLFVLKRSYIYCIICMTAFKGNNEKKLLFEEALYLTKSDRPQSGGRYYYTAKSSNRDQKKNVRFQNNASASARKFHHSKRTIRRKTSLLHSSLGKNYSGSRNIYCKGLRINLPFREEITNLRKMSKE